MYNDNMVSITSMTTWFIIEQAHDLDDNKSDFYLLIVPWFSKPYKNKDARGNWLIVMVFRWS